MLALRLMSQCFRWRRVHVRSSYSSGIWRDLLFIICSFWGALEMNSMRRVSTAEDSLPSLLCPSALLWIWISTKVSVSSGSFTCGGAGHSIDCSLHIGLVLRVTRHEGSLPVCQHLWDFDLDVDVVVTVTVAADPWNTFTREPDPLIGLHSNWDLQEHSLIK